MGIPLVVDRAFVRPGQLALLHRFVPGAGAAAGDEVADDPRRPTRIPARPRPPRPTRPYKRPRRRTSHGAPVADPSKTRRVAPIEVFKDDSVEAILDIAKLTAPPGGPVPPLDPTDILRVKEMAENPNIPPDRALIDRVVRGLAAQLTDRKSIQSLLEEPDDNQPEEKGAAAKKKAAPSAKGDAGRAIQLATSNLLDPIFKAQGTKNDGFLRAYRRSLQTYLPPLLKNHLVPRVQAMIVLGEAANPAPEGLKLFQNEIASKSQVLWVKLWALEGICNIKKGGGRFPADEEGRVGLTIAAFLKQNELPWPIQMRGSRRWDGCGKPPSPRNAISRTWPTRRCPSWPTRKPSSKCGRKRPAPSG